MHKQRFSWPLMIVMDHLQTVMSLTKKVNGGTGKLVVMVPNGDPRHLGFPWARGPSTISGAGCAMFCLHMCEFRMRMVGALFIALACEW